MRLRREAAPLKPLRATTITGPLFIARLPAIEMGQFR